MILQSIKKLGEPMDFQQSRTYQNILNAYNLEAEANTRSELSAEQAEAEQYIEIAAVYRSVATNEKEHARIWMRQLNRGTLPDTEQNLRDSIAFASDLGNNVYREYARIAREEGYDDIAALFNGIANIELNHEATFRTLLEEMIRGELFCRPEESLWICMQCGNIMSGICAPEICPVCGFPQGYYRYYEEGSLV
ncbi:rubrerythrin [Anaerotaenia torta]|uniref:rubrerythrin family protein n=1 Tax=Anaerotaenia torta TaxID=433293 RepID=UPI003D1CD87C